MTIIRLEKLLKTPVGDDLNKIVQRAQNMEALASVLRAALPADAAQSLIAANLRDNGDLVLICTSSAWASRLRFESENLMSAALEAGFAAKNLRVSVSQETR